MTEDALGTRSSIVKLLNDAHNEVNARTGKRVYTLQEHYKVYSFKKHRQSNTLLRDIVIFAVIAIVVARITRRANVHG
jgi:chorismate-pyruvate lyase